MSLITPVQLTGGHQLAQDFSISKAFASDVTAGNTIIVMAGCYFTADMDPAGVEDTQGNTYTQVITDGELAAWTAVAGSSGPLTVTATLTNDEYSCIGIAELPAGTYTVTDIGRNSKTASGTVCTSEDFDVTDTGAVLFAMMTCQVVDPISITEDGDWTLISENEDSAYLPYSWMWRNADAGTYQAEWMVGNAGTLAYMGGLLVEGTPAPTPKVGAAVFGVNTTVKATRAVAFGLDGSTNVHTEPGKFKVYGRGEYTQDLKVIDPISAQDAVPKHYCDANGGGSVESIIHSIVTAGGEVVVDSDGYVVFAT